MKNYLIIGLIALAMLIAPGVSAQSGGVGGGGNVGCAPPSIDSINIVAQDANPIAAGLQITPQLPSQCLDVTKCNASPVAACQTFGANNHCEWNATGGYVGVSAGTHCLDASQQPVLCTFTEKCDDDCAYNAAGQYVGPNKGGYTYDEDDGYKLGLKTLTVQVVVSTASGIKAQICEGGGVYLTVDNYDLQKTKVIKLLPVDLSVCNNASATTATFNGSFKMHYWEKPGWYSVEIEAVECCTEKAIGGAIFEYTETPAVCVAPAEKTMNYGTMIPGQSAYALGDVIKSNCSQCDIGTAPATVRNIGNAVINVDVSSSHMDCVVSETPGCAGNRIPVTEEYTNGVIYIDLGNGWKQLSKTSTAMNLTAQDYCTQNVTLGCPNCSSVIMPVYGLPPGPHATNNLSLMINPVPNVAVGYYMHTVTITPKQIEKCCQDHREIAWPTTKTCITPPQCYETGRYGVAIGANPGVTCNKLA